MYVVMVCGGMGSGKSTAVSHLEERGVETLSLDEVSHEVLVGERQLRDDLITAFGPSIVGEDGAIVPSRLAEVAFVDDASAARLRRITFPYITTRAIAHLESLRQRSPEPEVVIVEVPLLEEAGDFAEIADEVVAIVAPVDMRLDRAAARCGSRQDAEARIAVQTSDDVRMALADTVIVNDGTLASFLDKVDAWFEGHAARGWCT